MKPATVPQTSPEQMDWTMKDDTICQNPVLDNINKTMLPSKLQVTKYILKPQNTICSFLAFCTIFLTDPASTQRLHTGHASLQNYLIICQLGLNIFHYPGSIPVYCWRPKKTSRRARGGSNWLKSIGPTAFAVLAKSPRKSPEQALIIGQPPATTPLGLSKNPQPTQHS